MCYCKIGDIAEVNHEKHYYLENFLARCLVVGRKNGKMYHPFISSSIIKMKSLLEIHRMFSFSVETHRIVRQENEGI